MAEGWRPGPYRDLTANRSEGIYELREMEMIRAAYLGSFFGLDNDRGIACKAFYIQARP
jgi:hypothetical protein